MIEQEVESEVLSDEMRLKIEKRVKRTEFEDVSTYITYVLKQVLYELEEDGDPKSTDEIDEGQVEERLKSLGYLNE